MKYFKITVLISLAFLLSAYVIKETKQDEDMSFYVNDGGVMTEAFKIEGSSGETELKIRSDASCGAGNFCSGESSVTVTDLDGASGFTSVVSPATVKWVRIGSFVHIAGTVTGNGCNGAFCQLQVALPIASNFAAEVNFSGGCSATANEASVSDHNASCDKIFASASTDTFHIRTFNAEAFSRNFEIGFSGIYKIIP